MHARVIRHYSSDVFCKITLSILNSVYNHSNRPVKRSTFTKDTVNAGKSDLP